MADGQIVLTFKLKRDTTRTRFFEEEPGEQQWSEGGVAVGRLYVKHQALELIGNPTRVKVTIEPAA